MKLSFAAAAAILASTAAASPEEQATSKLKPWQVPGRPACYTLDTWPADGEICGPPGGDDHNRLRVNVVREGIWRPGCQETDDWYSLNVSYTEGWWKTASRMAKGLNETVESLNGAVKIQNIVAGPMQHFDFDLEYGQIYPGTPVNITITKFTPEGEENMIDEVSFIYEGANKGRIPSRPKINENKARKHAMKDATYAAPECEIQL
ncbi:hypothetical protein PG985_008336 [Apiospora marii]|uniref:Uncharacterized protein n=1 Tax=Apiospora marii TaxID=335849 RepID=A0ABR1SRN8_9PEZI